jgi:hypothetical protein
MNRPTFRLRVIRLLERMFPLRQGPTLLGSYLHHFNQR